MHTVLFISALLIISGLAFYAGTLLYKVKTQHKVRQLKTQQRISSIVDSIQTIAKAMEQQQCNLSEGSIRLFRLLECIPLSDKPDFSQRYLGLYSFYEQIKHFPTHEVRKAQSKEETRLQDLEREEIEVQFESAILSEIKELKTFTAR